MIFIFTESPDIKRDIDSGIYKRLWIPIHFWLGAAVGNLTSKTFLLPESYP